MKALDPKAIAIHFGGDVNGRDQVNIPTPGHSKRDRGTSITLKQDAPDGVVVHCHNGSPSDALAVKDQLREAGFLPKFERSKVGRNDNLPPVAVARDHGVHLSPGQSIVATFEYIDLDGHVRYRTHRIEPSRDGTGKEFRYDRPSGETWLPGLGDELQLPYGLASVAMADPSADLYLVEGERKADKLISWGLQALSLKNIDKWFERFAGSFKGRRVFILPDNDEAGERYAAKAAELVGPNASIVRVPGLGDGGDILDWDGGPADLVALSNGTHATSQSDERLLPYEWVGDVEPVIDGFWLIEDWLPKTGIAAIYGHPGSGKSFLALHMAAHVAQGATWHDRHVEQGLVVYVVAEGQTGFKNRIVAMRASGELSADAPFVLIPTPIDLQSVEGDAGALAATIRKVVGGTGMKLGMVVVDTLSKTFGAGKENTDDMVSYVNNCQRIASEFDCLTVVVHHRPKESESRDLRGHSSLRGNIDTAILVEAGDIKTATTLKQKDGEDNQRIRFSLERVIIGTDKRGKEISTCLTRLVDGESPSTGMPLIERKKRDLKGVKRAALAAIEEVIAKHGSEPPADIPADAIDRYKTWHAVQAGQVADRLKDEFFALGDGAPDKKSDTAGRTARRAMKDLKEAGILGTWKDWVWVN